MKAQKPKADAVVRKPRRKTSPQEVARLEAKIRDLPPSAGIFLIASGAVGGLVIPGLPGALIALLGGMVLVPKQRTLAKLDQFLKNSAPELRLEGYRFVNRFFTDLDRRFPKSNRVTDHENC